MNSGKDKLKFADPEQNEPLGGTCAVAFTAKDIAAPLQTFLPNDSVTLAELPGGNRFGLIWETKFVNPSPKTVSICSSVFPVFVRLYTRSNSMLAQFDAVINSEN